MGMAIFATEATRVTEHMFIVAAQAVAEQVTEENLSMGLIYPPQSHILNASLHVAERIATSGAGGRAAAGRCRRAGPRPRLPPGLRRVIPRLVYKAAALARAQTRRCCLR